MALEAGINPNENMMLNGEFCNLVQNGQLLVLNNPMVVYTQENIENDCALVLQAVSNGNRENLNLAEICDDVNSNYFQFENVESSKDEYDLEINFHERQQVSDGLAVLDILYNNNTGLDHPDTNKLSEENNFDNKKIEEVHCISDTEDDDDVVFVKAFTDVSGAIPKKTSKSVKKKVNDTVSKQDVVQPRRNPPRKARMKSKKLSKEHILEEDFALLDSSDDEHKKSGKENKAPSKRCAPPSETLKQWPVNVHERPQYNSETKKVEAFDYSIKEAEKKTFKKPRLETVTVRRKSKKKYFTRKRKSRVVVEKKVPLAELKSLVNCTTKMLKEFFIERKEIIINPENEIGKADNFLKVLENQTILFSLVNCFGSE